MAKTIFFVEDEESLTQALATFLRGKGYIVEIAHNGKEAVKMLPTVRPDLILLDIILPEMSGLDFLKEIQQPGSEYADIPVLVLTNLQGDEENFRKMNYKIAGYCVKANTPLEELSAKIKAILEK